ncbi:TetR/AcrR family transcriptional regulator [Skermania sp. ID1734]|uniref:TetR/AcrR family transcriptional regulator n=1 Tax=Skermania sp. ID1734 TaxID=2597516 RepID=UPI00118039AB|nr:TetR/AcrR family transcriptional regulator [Skermania sp. ID1734]TSD99433.1 TetR/AcrR family transcriptional regulator [Skermania sp. ID1734]
MTQVVSSRTYGGQLIEDRQRERRERFLESGLNVFARDGYASSSVGAICKDAGLSSRQFYEEFTGREALLIELCDRIENSSRDAVLAAMDAQSAPRIGPKIEAGVRAYVESVGRDPRRARVALVEAVGASPRMEQYRLAQRQSWATMLQRFAEEMAGHGEIPAGDYAMRVSAILGAVSYVVYDWTIASPRPDLDDVIRVLVRTLVGAISS